MQTSISWQYIYIYIYIPQTVFTLKGFWRILLGTSDVFRRSARLVARQFLRKGAVNSDSPTPEAKNTVGEMGP